MAMKYPVFCFPSPLAFVPLTSIVAAIAYAEENSKASNAPRKAFEAMEMISEEMRNVRAKATQLISPKRRLYFLPMSRTEKGYTTIALATAITLYKTSDNNPTLASMTR